MGLIECNYAPDGRRLLNEEAQADVEQATCHLRGDAGTRKIHDC
jgi:hypothetical protein